jgi:hypothetical protein
LKKVTNKNSINHFTQWAEYNKELIHKYLVNRPRHTRVCVQERVIQPSTFYTVSSNLCASSISIVFYLIWCPGFDSIVLMIEKLEQAKLSISRQAGPLFKPYTLTSLYFLSFITPETKITGTKENLGFQIVVLLMLRSKTFSHFPNIPLIS